MRRIAVLLFAMLAAWPAVAQEAYPSRTITSRIELWQPIIEKAAIQAE